MKVTVCDLDDCPEYATLHLKVLEGDFEALEFDACSFGHAEQYYDGAHLETYDDDDTTSHGKGED